MRLSKEDKEARVVELYKSGWSFRQLQRHYHLSPNYIANLVRGIEVTCATCGKPKLKVRFYTHHPERLNRPDYAIPLCPSCHVREKAKLRRGKENRLRSSKSSLLPATLDPASNPGDTYLPVSSRQLLPAVKISLKDVGVSSERFGELVQRPDSLDTLFRSIFTSLSDFDNALNKKADQKMVNVLIDQILSLGKQDNKTIEIILEFVRKVQEESQKQIIGVIKLIFDKLARLEIITRCVPTGEIVAIELDDKREHHFRKYKSKEGLARPYRASRDFILGDFWVDLAEPED